MWGSSTQAEGKPHIQVTLGMSCFGLSGLFWLLNSRPSYYVNRDTLFCYHKASEVFLQRLMALYVASHYKVTAAGPWVNLSPLLLRFLHLLLPSGAGDHSTGSYMS